MFYIIGLYINKRVGGTIEMRGFRKVILSILILLMLFSTLTGCGNGGKDVSKGKDNKKGKTDISKNFSETGYPIVNEKITLKMFGRKFASHADWNDMLLWKEYEKISNIHIDWELASDENLVERRNIILASDDLPDAFYLALFGSSDVVKYSSEGLFMPVDELIDKYAPNFKKLLEEDPQAKKALTMEDGKIYSFPFMSEADFLGYKAPSKIWYRTDWMSKLGLSEPANTDEFYELLKAFKEGDPNGNGQTDEIPLAPQSIGGLVGMLKGAWGLGNRGLHHPNVDVDEDTGKLRFIPTDDRYREILEYCHKLHKEGLLYEGAFTPDWSKYVAVGQEGLYGCIYGIGPILINQVENYEPASILKGPHGDNLWHSVGSTLRGFGNFIITAENKYPEATVRWIDYFYGDEGRLLFFMGKEGETFEVTSDGEYEFLDVITNNPDGLNLDQAVGQFTVQPGGGYPGLLGQKFFKGAEGRPESFEGSKKLEPYFPKEIWPANVYNVKQTEFMSSIGNDINTYVNESTEKFVRGDMPFSEWDKYVNTIKQMGLDEYMEIYEAATKKFFEE